MKITLVTVTLLAAASAQWQTWGGLNRWNNVGLGWNGLPLPATQVVAPISTSSQYHAQDELGQASFGYSHPGQSSATFQDAWGNQVGNYQYVNPEGKLVRVDFVADALGFRVASNALPEGPAVPVVPKVALPVGPSPVEDTAEVKQARAEHLAAVAEVRSRSRRSVQLISPWTRTVATPLAAPWAHSVATPLAAPWAHSVATPLAAPWAHSVATPLAAPWAHSVATPWAQTVATPWAVPASSASQYHAQDELGQARFGYSHPGANHHVARDAAGNQVGSYSYVDAEGKVIVTSYVADALGFRVVSNGLPVAPSAASTPALVGPAPVQDSAEVAAAKAEHFAAHAAARAGLTPVVAVVGPAPVQDTPEVAAAKAEHFAAHSAARAALV